MYIIVVYFHKGQQKKHRVIPVTHSILKSVILKLASYISNRYFNTNTVVPLNTLYRRATFFG